MQAAGLLHKVGACLSDLRVNRGSEQKCDFCWPSHGKSWTIWSHSPMSESGNEDSLQIEGGKASTRRLVQQAW